MFEEATHPEPPDRSTNAIDEFESMFKRAERASFRYEDRPIASVAVVTDTDAAASEQLRDQVQKHFTRLDHRARFETISADRYRNVNDLLDVLHALGPDLLVTSRCLSEEALVPQHTLGVYVDVLTQVTEIPVLLLPGTAPQPRPLADKICRHVMVIADRLEGDDQLVNAAARFCPHDGTLTLAHIEDDRSFRRTIEAIGRIPQINTDQARDLIGEQLLASAKHYIESCVKGLVASPLHCHPHQVVEFGHRVVRYRQLVEEHNVDLLVTNTKQEDQLAINGLAYALSVELTEVPQLLL